MHALVLTPEWTAAEGDSPGPAIRRGGPRFGLIVSKAVGTAVVRHRVARRLRHICAPLTAVLPADADIVIRALPGAAAASSAELDRQLRAALRKFLPDGADPGDSGGPS